MSDPVAGSRQVLEYLLEAKRKGRLGHTLLLAGGGGQGAYEVAVGLAQALLCPETSREDISSRSSHGRTCRVCRNVARLAHPDFLVVAPSPTEPERKRLRLKEGEDPVVQALARDLYATIETGANWRVTTEQGRALIRWASMTPWEAPAKVALIAEADRLREETADILLKTLEEPPDDATIILVSARPQDLLPTVRSRCHQARIPPLGREEMVRLLIERGIEEDRARAVAPLAGGDLWQARALLDGEMHRLRTAAAQLIGATLDSGRITAEVMAEVRTVLEGAATSDVSELVRWIIWWLRDLLLCLAGLDAPKEHVGELLAPAEKLGRERLMAWLEQADRAYEMLGRNVTPLAVVTALVAFPRDERRIGAATTFPPFSPAIAG